MTATKSFSTSDDRAIRDVLLQFEMAWNNRDVRTLTAAFVANGIYINVKDEVAEGHSAILGQFARLLASDGEGSYATFSIDRVWASLMPNAALMRGRVQIRVMAEEAVRSRQLRLLLALQQASGGLWQVALLHETLPPLPGHGANDRSQS